MVSPRNRLGISHVPRPPFLIRAPDTDKIMRSTAPTILSAVQQTLSVHGGASVTVVGHSLGAALSLLDGVYLRIHLSTSVSVRVVGYGMPRVGNQDFADWVDSHLGGQVTHINNRENPIPIVPGRFLGFHHASGEVHITDDGTWENCPGELFSSLVSRVRHFCGALTRASVRVAFQARTILLLCASSAMYRTSSMAPLAITAGPTMASRWAADFSQKQKEMELIVHVPHDCEPQKENLSFSLVFV